MTKLPAGYTRRPDGTWARKVYFDAGPVTWIEVLVRSQDGRLLRVERGRQATTKRKDVGA